MVRNSYYERSHKCNVNRRIIGYLTIDAKPYQVELWELYRRGLEMPPIYNIMCYGLGQMRSAQEFIDAVEMQYEVLDPYKAWEELKDWIK